MGTSRPRSGSARWVAPRLGQNLAPSPRPRRVRTRCRSAHPARGSRRTCGRARPGRRRPRAAGRNLPSSPRGSTRRHRTPRPSHPRPWCAERRCPTAVARDGTTRAGPSRSGCGTASCRSRSARTARRDGRGAWAQVRAALGGRRRRERVDRGQLVGAELEVVEGPHVGPDLLDPRGAGDHGGDPRDRAGSTRSPSAPATGRAPWPRRRGPGGSCAGGPTSWARTQRPGHIVSRDPGVTSPSRCLSVSSPDARGQNAMTPVPACSTRGSRSSSIVRPRRL